MSTILKSKISKNFELKSKNFELKSKNFELKSNKIKTFENF